MNKLSEKLEFSARLKHLLADKGWSTNKPTWLARQFNMRFEGEPVSVPAVNNWLTGSSIPSQEKLRVLASWLEVNPEWLRYGDNQESLSESNESIDQGVPYGLSDLPEKFERLTPRQKRAIYEVINSMLDSASS